MSRKQWVILGALALAVVLVFGCLGGAALTYLTGQPPTETPEAAEAAETQSPTGSPTATLSPTPTPPAPTPAPPTPTNTRVIPMGTITRAVPASTPTTIAYSGDGDYLLCAENVAVDVSEANYGMTVVVVSKDVPLICSVQPSYASTLRQLSQRHSSCPQPHDAHLQAAARYLDAVLAEVVEAADCIGRYCAQNRDVYWLEQASAHLERTSQLGALADQEIEAYRRSQ